MNREILFRGKRVDNGEWVEGYLWIGATHAYIIPHNSGIGYDDKIHFMSAPAHEIDRETICQYTGLTDKNGWKIFEGDIVNCHEKRGAAFWHCKVVWNEVKARFDVIAMDCAFPMCLDNVGDDISIDGLDYSISGCEGIKSVEGGRSIRV